jgi:hypothetical protein
MRDPSLRVSVATLVRVVFQHPRTAVPYLALERKATVLAGQAQSEIRVRTQPFGGAVRIRDLVPLRELIGEVRFDSQRSEAEEDFRILIQAQQWPAVRAFCLRHLVDANDLILETSPDRELAEEFWDTLGVCLTGEQYTAEPVATLIEGDPARTENVHAQGQPTVRVYRVFEVRILDGPLVETMVENSTQHTDLDLRQMALAQAEEGRPGRANAMLCLPLNWLKDLYRALPPDKRGEAVQVTTHWLEGNVSAVLPGVTVPKYEQV